MNKFAELKLFLSQNNQPRYRFEQIIESIFSQKEINFSAMFFLPKELRRQLEEKFGSFLTVKLVEKKTSRQAKKVAFSLADDKKIEAVKMKYRDWQSVCLSSQVGCPLKCAFCATGKMGFSRHLTVDEIVDQLLYFYLEDNGVDTVSFMGMGEPLLNKNIFPALEIIIDSSLFNISQRKINISTVGILPSLKQLIDAFPSINIALSLNSPFPEQRQSLMPIEKKFPLAKILPLLNYHIRTNHRKVFLSYILLSDVNDTIDHVDGLADLIRRQGDQAYLYHVNLITYHPVPGVSFKAVSSQQTNFFQNRLKRRGVNVTLRRSLGLSLQGACGQLKT
jgi:23S rRNA (adenine-C8)-methyltransferase